MRLFSLATVFAIITEISAFSVLRTSKLQNRNGLHSLKAVTADELRACQKDLFALVDKTNSNPILIRLAWHDAGTYDKNYGDSKFPKCGGANGSIRFEPEINHGANAGLTIALNLLKPIKQKHESVGWADLLQMSSAVAIEHAGGPKINMKYGRIDAKSPEDCAPDGNLPGAAAPFKDGSPTPGDHLRRVFYRMGLDDKDIVALSGAHTLGRAWKTRSGFGAEKGTKFTTGDVTPRADGKPGYGSKGGSSWTETWLKFDNSYFTIMRDEHADAELLKLETDKNLFDDAGFKPIAQKYAEDENAFFADYAVSHKKLSELGAKFSPAEGISL